MVKSARCGFSGWELKGSLQETKTQNRDQETNSHKNDRCRNLCAHSRQVPIKAPAPEAESKPSSMQKPFPPKRNGMLLNLVHSGTSNKIEEFRDPETSSRGKLDLVKISISFPKAVY
jgi:hypothetical protein